MILCLIQARMGSTRLPGKVLMDVAGQNMLARVIERVRRSLRIQQVAVATTESPSDDAIVEECRRVPSAEVPVFRGSEQDVLNRYYRAALQFGADAVVRVTSDCPLIDPQVVDRVIDRFTADDADYASNTLERSYPRGLDVEVFRFAALEEAWRDARLPHQREHVTPYLYQHPERFRLVSVRNETDHSDHRWTVDTAEDLHVVRTIYERLGPDGRFGWLEVLELLNREPHLAEINRHIEQKPLTP